LDKSLVGHEDSSVPSPVRSGNAILRNGVSLAGLIPVARLASRRTVQISY
jgi:hypothetical protein